MILKNKYKILDVIGQGTFGSVFKGTKIKSKELVAIKVAYGTTNVSNVLKHEATVLNYLQNCKCINIPLVFYYGCVDEKFVLVMPYYDFSLHEYIQENMVSEVGRNLFCQSLRTFQDIHQHNIIHRDIKPDNIRVKADGQIVIIDFGLATSVIDDDGFVPDEMQTTITGSPTYISHFIHKGEKPSMRDDLISLCYVFMELCIGSLPWQIPSNFQNEIILDDPVQQQIILDKSNLLEFIQLYKLPMLTKCINYFYSLDYNHYANFDALFAHVFEIV